MSIQAVTTAANRVGKTSAGREAMAMMAGREFEFRSPLEAKLAAIGMIPGGREALDGELQKLFEAPVATDADEVVVGSGWHGTAYATGRVARGFPAPLVLEASDYPGGVFAASRRASFRANSRNRPGPLGLPGQGRGLNVIPGAMVQPSMLSTDEFQTNADLAFSVRLALAMAGQVRPNSRVMGVDVTNAMNTNNRRYEIPLADGEVVTTDRIVDARGLGSPRTPQGVRFDGQTVLTFEQLMRKLDDPFPFRRWQRVAVVGAGDGAKCAVEALLGIGPSQRSSLMLDYVREVDWYDATGDLPANPQEWARSARCRYAAIGGFLPRVGEVYDNRGRLIARGDSGAEKLPLRASRLAIIPASGAVQNGMDCAFANGQTYDAVVVAIGYEPWNDLVKGRWLAFTGDVSNVPIARRLAREDAWKVGPRADLPFDSADLPRVTETPQNVAAIFRLVGRTAQLSLSLGTPSKL